MKVASATLVLATFCCASAFGLTGPKTVGLKKMGLAANTKAPMVQAIDVQGNRLSNSNVVRMPLLKRPIAVFRRPCGFIRACSVREREEMLIGG